MTYDKNLCESDRVARWRQRLEFELLNDAERRNNWKTMPFAQRGQLGLNAGFWDSRFGMSSIYSPQGLRPMRFPISTILSQIYKPYQSKSRLVREIRDGAESALAFAVRNRKVYHTR